MYGYYSYYMVFGVLVTRLTIAVVLSGCFGIICRPVVAALKRNKLI
jgi:hypothetical protein